VRTHRATLETSDPLPQRNHTKRLPRIGQIQLEEITVESDWLPQRPGSQPSLASFERDNGTNYTSRGRELSCPLESALTSGTEG
jgi:hypothetical protein